MPAPACSNIIRSDGTLSLGEDKMAAREDWARITRGVAEALSSLSSEIGSVRTMTKEKRVRRRSIQLVSWAGRADTDAWFRAELEQSKNRALIYYTKNQIR